MDLISTSEQGLRYLMKTFSGQISQFTSQVRLDYKRKHLQENTAVTGTARNKRSVHFQEEKETGIRSPGSQDM